MLPPVETETVMISSKLSFPLCILIKTKTKKNTKQKQTNKNSCVPILLEKQGRKESCLTCVLALTLATEQVKAPRTVYARGPCLQSLPPCSVPTAAVGTWLFYPRCRAV